MVFNKYQGFFQGNILFGKEFIQNCPGFTAYKIKVLKKIIQEYSSYIIKYEKRFNTECRWGGDMVLAFFAKRKGFKVNYNLYQTSRKMAPNRDVMKILNQLEKNTQHLILILELYPEQ